MSALPDPRRREPDPAELLEECFDLCDATSAPDPRPFIARAGARGDELRRRLALVAELELALELLFERSGPVGRPPRFSSWRL